MPKYCGKQIFTHGRFPEVGQKQKTEREKVLHTYFPLCTFHHTNTLWWATCLENHYTYQHAIDDM